MGNVKRVLKVIVTCALLGLAVTSCVDDEYEYVNPMDQYLEDVEIIENYIVENNLDAYNIDSTGVYLAITEEGTINVDSMPTYTSTVTTTYKGYFTDGTVFDQTAEGESATFSLQDVITGWTIAFPELSVGDKATILIPSYYGYGTYAVRNIPANSVLIFDVELLSFQ